MPDAPLRVLVIDDDATVSEVVTRYLEREGYVVEAVGDGQSGLDRVLAEPPDLVVLDLMLPGLDGLEVCRRLRALAPVPVIMLTAKGEETDRIIGLEIGADDYMSKPFSPKELTARVKAVLRRARGPLAPPPGTPPILSVGDLEVDVRAHEARVRGELAALTAREFELLVFLMRHPRQAFRREELLEHVWGYTYGDTSTVTVHVRRLREKIETDPADPRYITTVWGVGYRFEPERAPGVTLPAHAIGELALFAVSVAVAVGLLGWLLLRRLRGSSLRAQVTVVALVGVAATAVGVIVGAQAMFVSRHDLDALLVLVGASGAVGVLAAIGLGTRVARSSASLRALTRSIGDGQARSAGGPPVAISDLARLGDELSQMSTRLEASRQRERSLESARRELVAWVSHDLRTPLAGIRAMVEALEDGVVSDPGTVARYYRTMRTEADRLAGLVDDLFELSRIQADALQLTIERVSLGDLVSDALASAAVTAAAKGVHLAGELVEAAPLVDLSTPEMARVVHNLLDNAIRHTPPGGEVRVAAGADDGHAFVAVADSCGGIPDRDLGRVFDLAFRGDAARSPGEGGGTGLGLAIAKGLVLAHAGEIDVRNEGDGCRFTVRLPLVQPRP